MMNLISILREFVFLPIAKIYVQKFRKLSLLGFLLLGILSCKKQKETPETLPPVSSTGANTFGAVVNGKIITARGSESFSGGILPDMAYDSCYTCYLPPDSNDLFLRIEHKDLPISYIFLTDPRHTSEWRLNQSTKSQWETKSPKSYIEIDYARTGITTDGYLRSDFRDRKDWIFSAEFSYQCTNPKTCQEYKVENGRIDVNLRSIPDFP